MADYEDNDYPYDDGYYDDESKDEVYLDDQLPPDETPIPVQTYFDIVKDNYNNNVDFLKTNLHLSKYIDQFEGMKIIQEEDNNQLFTSADILIVCNLGMNYTGPNSAVYKAYEMYHRLQMDNIDPDLGGLRIQLLFCDWFDVSKTLALEFYKNEILKAIFTKYKGSKDMYTRLNRDIIFLKQPKLIAQRIMKFPYCNDYLPSSMVLVDTNKGEIPDVLLQVDNLHIISDQFLEKDFIKNKESINFFCLYTDFRTSNHIIRKENFYNHPRVIVYDNIERILFNEFAPTSSTNDNYYNVEHLKDTTKFLIYIKENAGVHDADEIIEAIPMKYLNTLGQDLRKEKIQLKKQFQIYNDSNKLTKIQKEAINASGQLQNSKFESDRLYEEIKITFIIVGLNETNRNFEEVLVSRAAQKGILINTIVFNQDQLPISDLFSWFDIYIYSNAIKQDPSRFIPECKFYNKKIIYTKSVKKYLNYNFSMKVRINDTEKHFNILDEYTIYDPKKMLPKSKLLKNLLGYWQD